MLGNVTCLHTHLLPLLFAQPHPHPHMGWYSQPLTPPTHPCSLQSSMHPVPLFQTSLQPLPPHPSHPNPNPPNPPSHSPRPQVLYAAAVATPNQDTAFMVAIAWTAVNILMSNYLGEEGEGRRGERGGEEGREWE